VSYDASCAKTGQLLPEALSRINGRHARVHVPTPPEPRRPSRLDLEVSDSDLALPALLHVRQIGQLKQVVAEVIIVMLPVNAALLGLALRLVELHPKPPRATTMMTTWTPRRGGEPDDDDGHSGR
jgi:hypothetical protein